MDKHTRPALLFVFAAGLTPGSSGAWADDAAETFSLRAAAAAVRSAPGDVAPVRFVIDPPRRGLGLEGAAFGAAFGGLLVGIPAVISGGDSDSFKLTLVSAGIGAVAGGLVGTIHPRSRGPADLRVGDPLRLASNNAISGTFQGASDAGVILRLPTGEERVIPYRDALEVRRSTRLTAVGAVTGASLTLAGVLLLHAVLCEGECSDGPSGIAYAFVGGGAVLGAGLGALVKAQDWRQVRPEVPEAREALPRRHVSFKLAPARGKGVRGQVSLRWR